MTFGAPSLGEPSSLAVRTRTIRPSRRSSSTSTAEPTTSSGATPYSRSLAARTNSTPPPVTMNTRNPWSRSKAINSSIGA